MKQTVVLTFGGTSVGEIQGWAGRNGIKHSKDNCTILQLKGTRSLHWHMLGTCEADKQPCREVL